MRKEELADTASVSLPQPMQPDPQLWPAMARVWLYKAGLSNDDITGLGFYFCDRTQRVVMPVYQDGKLVYWQARGFNSAHAKYINPVVSRDKLFAKYGSGGVIVLTEDMLSAFRVGKVTEAWALMGTSISDGMLDLLTKQQRPIRTMLDPDKAGIKGGAKALRQLQLLGVDIKILRPHKDPKLLTLKEIELCITT